MDKNHDIIDTEKFAKFLKTKNISDLCALCGQSKLEAHLSAYFLIEVNQEMNPLHIERAKILVAMTCSNCGHMVFINALKHDLLKPLETDDGEVTQNG